MVKTENEKSGGGLANLANLANYTLEQAKQAASRNPEQQPEAVAETEARRALRAYRYRLREMPGSDLILIAPGTDLADATEGLKRRFGSRLVDVVEYRPHGRA